MILYRLNLLPPTQKKSIDDRVRLRWWCLITCLIMIFSLLGFGGGLFGRWLITQHQSVISRQYEVIESGANKLNADTINRTTAQLNSTINTFDSTLSTSPSWGKAMLDILNLIPDKVSIQRLTIQPDGSFVLIGQADTRQSFLTLQETLTSASALSDVTTTSTASKRSDIPFNYTGRIKLATP